MIQILMVCGVAGAGAPKYAGAAFEKLMKNDNFCPGWTHYGDVTCHRFNQGSWFNKLAHCRPTYTSGWHTEQNFRQLWHQQRASHSEMLWLTDRVTFWQSISEFSEYFWVALWFTPAFDSRFCQTGCLRTSVRQFCSLKDSETPKCSVRVSGILNRPKRGPRNSEILSMVVRSIRDFLMTQVSKHF